jgi:hypothetical protein
MNRITTKIPGTKRQWFPLSLVVFFAFSGCSASVGTSGSKPDMSQMQTSPTQIAIGSNTFGLDTYFWRNAMPQIAAPGQTPDPIGAPFQAKVTVQEINGRNIPSDIKIAKMWVANSSQSVEPQFTCTQPSASQLMCRFDNGPAWATSSTAYVVIALVDATGTQYFLKGQATPIIQTS